VLIEELSPRRVNNVGQVANECNLSHYHPLAVTVARHPALTLGSEGFADVYSLPLTMNTYPDELLVEIFSHLGILDRVTATCVCKVWRTASHEHPASLWSRLWISDSKKSACSLWDMLKRSQHPVTGAWVPIDIHIELGYDYGHYALPIIAEHMHHIRTLTVWQSQRFPLTHDAALKIRAAVLLSGAPVLEHLELDFEYIDDHEGTNEGPDPGWLDVDVGNGVVASDRAEAIRYPWMAIPPEAFAGQAPRLRSLHLNGEFVILQDCPALANLDALSIEVGTAGVSDPDRRQEFVNKTVQAISRIQSLRHLRLSSVDMALFSAITQRLPMRLSLNELHVSTFAEQNPLPLLRHFNFEQADLIRTMLYDGWTADFERRASSPPSVLDIRPPPFNVGRDAFYDWHLATADGRIWIYYMGYPSPDSSTFDYLGRNLSALSLPITHCAKFTELRFVQLERLAVVLTSHAEISPLGRHDEASPVAEKRSMHVPDAFKMECPVLSELRLTCNRSNPQLPPLRWTVSTKAITEFIDHHLVLSEAYFERVHLCNLRLVDEDSDSLAATSVLQTRYGTVVVSSQSQPHEELIVPASFWSSTGPYSWDKDEV